MTHDAATHDDATVRAACERLGLNFKPWEVHPADVDDGPSPWPSGAGHDSWPLAQRLRRRLLVESAGAKTSGPVSGRGLVSA